MEVTSAEIEDVDAVAELWVALARGQRRFGSHLRADANRTTARQTVARHIVTGGLLLARGEPPAETGSESRAGESPADAVPATADVPSDLLGFVMFSLESGSYQQDVTRGVIGNIYVRPACRGQGIGSRLLAAAEAALADEGADTVGLEAMADNVAARRFYERAGYEPHRIEFEKRVESDTDTSGAE